MHHKKTVSLGQLSEVRDSETTTDLFTMSEITQGNHARTESTSSTVSSLNTEDFLSLSRISTSSLPFTQPIPRQHAHASQKTRRRLNILALDGGGMRGTTHLMMIFDLQEVFRYRTM